MTLHAHLDDKVAVVAAVSARRALSAQDDALHIIDACRDGDLKLLVDLDEALAVAILAGSLYDLTRAATLLTGALGLHIAEHRLLSDGDATRSMTYRAGLGLRALFRTRGATIGTGLDPREGYLLLTAECRLLEVNGDASGNVLTVYRHIASRASASAAATATSEEGGEYVTEVKVTAAKSAEAAITRAAAHRGIERRVTELIVLLTLLLVRENVVRLIRLLELRLGFLVTGVHIGVILLCKAAIRFLYLVVRGGF